MKTGRFVALLLIAGLLSGCSAVRFAYNNADTALRWMADGYLDFEPPQADDFSARLGNFHSWHRRRELPRYSALLVSASNKLADGLTQEELDWALDNVNIRLRAMAEQAAPEMAVVFGKLDPEQIEHMEKKFVETNADFFKEHVKGGETEQRKRRMKRNLELFQDVYGNLSDAQERQLRELSDKLPLLYELRAHDRVRRQKEIAALIRENRSSAEFAPKLAHWLANWEEGRAPEYQRLTVLHRRQYMQMLLDLDKGMTAAQRANAVKRLRKYAEDFRVLAEEGKSASPGS